MTVQLPFEVLFLQYLLWQNSFDAFLVGGAVRDLLLEERRHSIKDFDLTSNATPEQLLKVLPHSFYENSYGTVSVTHQHLLSALKDKWQLPAHTLQSRLCEKQQLVQQKQHRIIDLANAKKIHVSLQKNNKNIDKIDNSEQIAAPFEITTYRSDGIYSDHRRPETVSWGSSLEEDLQRRDFTMNALAIQVAPEILQQIFQQKQLQETYQLVDGEFRVIDYHQGIVDLAKHQIRTVGDADQRFKEDALRMMRAIRLAVELEFDIETDTYFAIKANAALLQYISAERIRDEFLRMLVCRHASQGIHLLDDLGLLNIILPELAPGKNMQQRGHHISDVWTHSLAALDACPSSDPIVRFATLLHDVGKPVTYKNEAGAITFYNHDLVGARLASRIAQRLRLSKKDIQRVFTLVRYHMFYYQPYLSDAAIRRFMRKVGLENIDDILDLREGDRLGSGAKKTSWRLEEMKTRIIQQLNQPMDMTDLAIDGTDLMSELQLKPGPILGQILHYLLELVLEDPQLNQRPALLRAAREYMEEQQHEAAKN